jgi:hypothetical protein
MTFIRRPLRPQKGRKRPAKHTSAGKCGAGSSSGLPPVRQHAPTRDRRRCAVAAERRGRLRRRWRVLPPRKTTRHKLAMFFLMGGRSTCRTGRPPGAGG